jgi:peptidoglycan/xylan/chitin deacetylase (PgdA/CDA1 family)
MTSVENRRNGVVDPELYLREHYLPTRARGLALAGFYAVKPVMPRGLQLELRRLYARRQERRRFPAWPIEPLLVEHEYEQLRARLRESAGDSLSLVNQWPDGRRFACVVTHDVETATGIANVEALLEVERRYGMVSSWNFVAEDYAIPDGVFDRIRAAGCEVGLHGLHHDGKLFLSRRTFDAALPAIHRHMADWGAVGFRSPGTHRNADWMANLGCLYDSSFPDTDPFEPRPGGCCSIFPYFLGELVELPITLPQDHTLWEILRVRSIGIWRKKSDWLIAHRGLINVIIHPDYVNTPERLGLYEQLLAYLRERVDTDEGWHALPHEVASWWRERATLRVEGEGDEARIARPAEPGPYADRATVSRVRERDGSLVFEP